jgi:hypothetical protein
VATINVRTESYQLGGKRRQSRQIALGIAGSDIEIAPLNVPELIHAL